MIKTEKTKLSWSCSNGSWIYNYLCNQCYHHWSCEFESRSCEVYSIQHYVIKFVSDLRQVVSSTNKTFRDDKTEILLKVALSTITLTLLRLYGIREHLGLPPCFWWCPVAHLFVCLIVFVFVLYLAAVDGLFGIVPLVFSNFYLQ